MGLEDDGDRYLLEGRVCETVDSFYDDFYGSYAINFDRYDEKMYDLLRRMARETTKNKYNTKRKEGRRDSRVCKAFRF